MTIVVEQFLGSRRSFDLSCSSYEFVSIGPKRLLKTRIFEKKASSPVKERFWPDFSRLIEQNKSQGTLHKGPEGLLAIIVQVMSL